MRRMIVAGVAAACVLGVAFAQRTPPTPLPAPHGHFGKPVLLKLLKTPIYRQPLFDIDGFRARFDDDMKKNGVPNYIVEIRMNGKAVVLEKSGYAKEPQDGAEPWAANVPMHIGSVSKLITAMAMVKLLDGLQNNATNPTPYKNPIVNFLPTYWTRGPGVGAVNFRNVLQHCSGFTMAVDESQPGYSEMRAVVAAGSSGTKQCAYQNVNYSLMRVLLAVLNGDMDKTSTPGDAAWDQASIAAYNAYLQGKVFAPAGVSGAVLSHPADCALAYGTDLSAPGWNSGDLSEFSGAAGWHLSIDQLLDVMGAYMRAGSIVTPAEANATLALSYGIDNTQLSPAGMLYSKGGDDFDDTGRIEQAAAFFVPGARIEGAAYVNMPIGPGVETALIADFNASFKEGSPFPTNTAE